MLKKLFVHEWKDCWRLVGLLNLIVLGLTIIGAFVFKNDVWTSSNVNNMSAILLVCYIMFYVISVCALGFVVSLYFYFRFYKNLYTDQGYLMHTLPVNAHQLIWSKTLVSFIWHLISVLVIFLSVFTLIFSAMGAYEQKDFFAELFAALGTMPFDFRIVLIVIEFLFLIIASYLMSIFMGYAAVSIGQQFKKQKLLGAVGIYIGIYMVIQMVSSFATLPLNNVLLAVNTEMEGLNAVMIIMLVLILIMGALAAAFYYITLHAMQNKLNLE